MMPSIINTLVITFLSLLIAVPLGIFSAIYLWNTPTREQIRGDHPPYHRDPVRYSFYRIRTVWRPLLCDHTKMGYSLLAGA